MRSPLKPRQIWQASRADAREAPGHECRTGRGGRDALSLTAALALFAQWHRGGSPAASSAPHISADRVLSLRHQVTMRACTWILSSFLMSSSFSFWRKAVAATVRSAIAVFAGPLV